MAKTTPLFDPNPDNVPFPPAVKISDLTVEQVETELRRLAAAQPDFVYNDTGRTVKCSYIHGIIEGPENKGCIFGQALQNLGVPAEELREPDPIRPLWNDLNSEKCPLSWGSVQSEQDHGASWGEAIKELD